MAQQTHFHSFKHCLLQLTHGFISSNNNQSFLSYNEELKQGNLLCRKYYYFFLYPLFRQHKHTNYMIIILSRMYQDLKFKTFFSFKKKKKYQFCIFQIQFLETAEKKIVGLLI